MGFALGELILKPDRPSLSVAVSKSALLECCYQSPSGKVDVRWIYHHNQTQHTVLNQTSYSNSEEIYCSQLNFPEVKLEDIGFYQCVLNDNGDTYYTHGTYLRVYSECACVYVLLLLGGGGVVTTS